MNRRNFINGTIISLIAVPFISLHGSTEKPYIYKWHDHKTLVIIPSERLANRYGLSVTDTPAFIDSTETGRCVLLRRGKQCVSDKTDVDTLINKVLVDLKLNGWNTIHSIVCKFPFHTKSGYAFDGAVYARISKAKLKIS
jgi:hypothetical protein